MSAHDGGQLGVEQAGEGEQVVALVLQRDTHRADASRVLGFAGHQLGSDEVEQLSPGRQVWAGQGQDVVAQPVHEHPNVAGEARRPSLRITGLPELDANLALWIPLTGASDPNLQRLAPRRGARGEAR